MEYIDIYGIDNIINQLFGYNFLCADTNSTACRI
jgi:hypothetical protein